MAFEKDPDELGALWSKTGAKGEYLTGNINGVGVVVFRNENKAPGSKAPDWRVLKAKKRDEIAPDTREPLAPLTRNDIPF